MQAYRASQVSRSIPDSQLHLIHCHKYHALGSQQLRKGAMHAAHRGLSSACEGHLQQGCCGTSGRNACTWPGVGYLPVLPRENRQLCGSTPYRLGTPALDAGSKILHACTFQGAAHSHAECNKMHRCCGLLGMLGGSIGMSYKKAEDTKEPCCMSSAGLQMERGDLRSSICVEGRRCKLACGKQGGTATAPRKYQCAEA